MWNKPVYLSCWCIFQVHRLCILKKLYPWQKYLRRNCRTRKHPVEPLLCQVHKSNTKWTPFRLGNTRFDTSHMRPLDLPRIVSCLLSIKYIHLYPVFDLSGQGCTEYSLPGLLCLTERANREQRERTERERTERERTSGGVVRHYYGVGHS
jgi:hypothetical protein